MAIEEEQGEGDEEEEEEGQQIGEEIRNVKDERKEIEHL